MKSLKIPFAIILFFAQLCYGQDTKNNEFKLLDNISINNVVYGINSKSTNSQFTLQVCDNSNCYTTRDYVMSISSQLLVNDVLEVIKTNLDSTIVLTSIPQEDKDQIAALKIKIQTVETRKAEARRTEVEKLLNSVDEEKDQYSAKIILNKYIPYDITYRIPKQNRDTTNPSSLSLKLFEQGIARQNINKAKYKDTTVLGQDTLKIVDAKIQFFNNKASSIYIKAELIKNGRAPEKIIFENNSFSVALRYFNKYGSTVSTQTQNQNWIIIDYNDVFDYESDQFFNYSIANSQISLSHTEKDKTEIKVIQRRFFDFFTGIVYTDVMGFNTENSNSILNAQAKLLLPLNLRNWKKLTLTRQFTTLANIALNNSFEDESRFIAIKDDETFSNFDLLRKNNLYGKINIDVFSYESKGWFLNTSLGYSAAFYRTGFRYTQTQPDDTDIITSTQLLSIGHGPYLNFEIRPQTNFGADIIIGLEDLNYNDTKSINGRFFRNDIIIDDGENHFVAKHNLVNAEANFYWLTNPNKSKGGIYAKLGCYYHTENYNIFPQIMVGYATNLTSFVNRFKPKKEVEDK
ncbi:hypothetical protein [Aestuariivivens insulae]|uniref:hypothetical protein n=1 Tax=Aestuariivivens insulae TaxID=1621988 RepID=UPI001F587262|nr:hypothetical protein [Aestuariivivens insulae]